MTDDPNRLPDDAGDNRGASDASDASDGASGASGANAEAGAARERRGPPPNPLYHPLFLPVLLVAFSLWFFWDGFITSDPDMEKHQLFNRISFGVTALLCLRVVPRGLREFKEDREAAAKEQ